MIKNTRTKLATISLLQKFSFLTGSLNRWSVMPRSPKLRQQGLP